MTYRDLLLDATNRLTEAGIDNPGGEAWYFFEDAFAMSRLDYMMDQLMENTKEEATKKFHHYIEERITTRTPMQYILGTQEFMGLTFQVNPSVLIPRMDTEVLVEEIINTVPDAKKILDMCTGSGCIAISLAEFLHPEVCIGADLSKDALNTAIFNGKTLAPMVSFIESDLFSKITGKFDLIVSNPPYIASSECDVLMPEVKDHEPRMALDGHEDGLYFYRKIVDQARKHLTTGGWLFFEIGYDQGESVPKLMEDAGYMDITVKKDLAGLDRVVYGRYE